MFKHVCLLVSTVFCKGYWAFFGFEFSRSQLIDIHEKIGTREKSPDNRIVRIIEVRIIEVRIIEVPLYSLLTNVGPINKSTTALHLSVVKTHCTDCITR